MLGLIFLCDINENLKSFHSTNTNKEQQGLKHCKKNELQMVYCAPLYFSYFVITVQQYQDIK